MTRPPGRQLDLDVVPVDPKSPTAPDLLLPAPAPPQDQPAPQYGPATVMVPTMAVRSDFEFCSTVTALAGAPLEWKVQPELIGTPLQGRPENWIDRLMDWMRQRGWK